MRWVLAIFSRISFRSASRTIGKVPSLLYAMIYVAFIPLFACIYSMMPGQFYHSTVKHEAHINRNADKLMKDLAECFIKQHYDAAKSNYKIIAGTPSMEFDLSTVVFSAPRIEGSYFHFEVSVIGKTVGKADEGMLRAHVKTLAICNHLGFEHSPPMINGSIRPGYGFLRLENEDDALLFGIPRPGSSFATLSDSKSLPSDSPFVPMKPSRDPLMPIEYIAEYDDTRRYFLMIPAELQAKLSDLSDAANGFPSAIGGNYWRMFYLSTVTITTLGFGDIVPLTGLARGGEKGTF